MIAGDAVAVAVWLLGVEVALAEPLTVELAADPSQADTVYRVVRADGRTVLLHIEFRGRSSRRPIPRRMLEYMTRLALREGLPLRSVVP